MFHRASTTTKFQEVSSEGRVRPRFWVPGALSFRCRASKLLGSRHSFLRCAWLSECAGTVGCFNSALVFLCAVFFSILPAENRLHSRFVHPSTLRTRNPKVGLERNEMYFLARAVALVAALYAAFHSLGLEQRVNPTNFHAQLGDHTYDVSKGKAPIVSGWALRALTLITTATPFGPAVRRFLINDNAVLDIRELAAQMPPGVVPLSFPVRRLNRKEREAHDATVADAKAAGTDLDSIIPFIKEPSVQKAASLSNSDVLAMHARFVMGSSTPTQVAEHTLERIKELQPVYKIFTAEPLRDEMLQGAQLALAVCDVLVCKEKTIISVTSKYWFLCFCGCCL